MFLIVLLKLFSAAVVHIVVDNCGIELHADGLQNEAENVAEDGIAGEEAFATEAIDGFVEGEEVPTEHDQRSGQAAANHQDDAGLYPICKTDLSYLSGGKVLQVEVKLIDFIVPEQGYEEVDD